MREYLACLSSEGSIEGRRNTSCVELLRDLTVYSNHNYKLLLAFACLAS